MTNPSFEKEGGDSLQEFEESHREQIEILVRDLAERTQRRSEDIMAHIHSMLSQLFVPQKQSSRKKTPQQKAHALREWAESHRGMNLPEVCDHVLNRESYYDDE